MEENIKVLEELINGAKEFNQYNGNKYYKAIENLIVDNKRLDKAKRLFEAMMKIADERDSVKADLYEANNRINDLLDLDTQKDKLIDEIILYIIRHNYFDTTEFDKNIVPTIENIRKHFEERCK